MAEASDSLESFMDLGRMVRRGMFLIKKMKKSKKEPRSSDVQMLVHMLVPDDEDEEGDVVADAPAIAHEASPPHTPAAEVPAPAEPHVPAELPAMTLKPALLEELRQCAPAEPHVPAELPAMTPHAALLEELRQLQHMQTNVVDIEDDEIMLDAHGEFHAAMDYDAQTDFDPAHLEAPHQAS
jgi:hypothetical protein